MTMTTLNLLTKINYSKQLKQVDKTLKLTLKGLKVEAKILGVGTSGWVQLTLTGKDEGVATSYLMKEIGVCPTSFKNLKEHAELKGYITNLANSKIELSLDIGVFKPENVRATLPLKCLQYQLLKGRKVALKKMADLFGFCEGLPIKIKVTQLNGKKLKVETELSENQKYVYDNWLASLLDRLLVLGPSLQEIKRTINQANLNRDVIDVEILGLFEHVFTCKLGTNAAGLIPKIGRILKKAKFAVFSPKRLKQFLSPS